MGSMTYKKNHNWAMLLLRPLYPLIRKAVDLETATDDYESLTNFCGKDHPYTDSCRQANEFEAMQVLDGAFHNLWWGRAKCYDKNGKRIRRRRRKPETDLTENDLSEMWDRAEPVELIPPEETK